MEFTNYGDINLLDEGGTLIGKTYPNPDQGFSWQNTTYTVIRIDPVDDDTVYAGYAEIDVEDYRDKEQIFAVYSLPKNCSDEELAFAVMSYCGLVELSAAAFNNPYAAYAMDLKEYRIGKEELRKDLKEIFDYDA